MEQALCMAHWLKRCKVNEPIYILLPSGWSDEADAPYSALLCWAAQRNVSGPGRLEYTFNFIQPT